ncbi:MAG TPA: hypothetical protein ENK52_00460 [Saprospiraceae bacterium]|nr:hypothetical protein [Saprospiraceae bacterium]
MTTQVVDWVQSKGALPYYYHLNPFTETFLQPEFRILSDNESIEVKQYLQFDRKIVEKLEMCHSVWQFHLINNLESTHLINDLNAKNSLEKLKQPITIYLTYPFTKVVELKLNPIIRKWKNGKTESFFSVGYIFWQVANVYASLYKNHWEEIGIKEHGLSDLYFEDCFIDSNGKASLFIGS